MSLFCLSGAQLFFQKWQNSSATRSLRSADFDMSYVAHSFSMLSSKMVSFFKQVASVNLWYPVTVIVLQLCTASQGNFDLLSLHCRFTCSGLSVSHCEIVASALKSRPTNLMQLTLSENPLRSPGVKLLCAGLESPNCKLQVLRSASGFPRWTVCVPRWKSTSFISCHCFDSQFVQDQKSSI